MELQLPDNLTVFCGVRWWPKGREWIEKHMSRIVLVKVRISIAADSTPHALVYDKDRSLYGFAPVEGALRKAMDGRTKGYFLPGSRGRRSGSMAGRLTRIGDQARRVGR